MIKKTWFVSCLMLVSISFNLYANHIKPGKWRFELRTTHAAIPFVVEFEYDKNNRLSGILHNGDEKIKLDDISHIDKEIFIPLQTYELTMELRQQGENSLVGHLIRKNKNPQVKTPVVGAYGYKLRYPEKMKKSTIELNGKWTLELMDENDQKSPAVGVFKQIGNVLTGSIVTPTGDYRYMEGVVQKDKFEAASFDGVYNYVFRGTIKDGKLVGEIASNALTKVTGSKDEKAHLPDAYKQTELPQLKFIFPDLKGQSVSLTHPKFKNKPVIVQIYGSWCPNCMDEMNYLIPWYHENNKRGIEIVALAFERSLSPEAARIQLLKVQNKLKVPYPILRAGSTSEDKPADKIQGLKNFISFPTTIFLNRKHEVVKVHAGFNGPSTGEFFDTWKKEFNQTVDELLKP